MSAENVEVEVQELDDRFIWVLRLTKPVRYIMRSYDSFQTRADAVNDWDTKIDTIRKIILKEEGAG